LVVESNCFTRQWVFIGTDYGIILFNFEGMLGVMVIAVLLSGLVVVFRFATVAEFKPPA
jgi:hypothetical protein